MGTKIESEQGSRGGKEEDIRATSRAAEKTTEA